MSNSLPHRLHPRTLLHQRLAQSPNNPFQKFVLRFCLSLLLAIPCFLDYTKQSWLVVRNSSIITAIKKWWNVVNHISEPFHHGYQAHAEVGVFAQITSVFFRYAQDMPGDISTKPIDTTLFTNRNILGLSVPNFPLPPNFSFSRQILPTYSVYSLQISCLFYFTFRPSLLLYHWNIFIYSSTTSRNLIFLAFHHPLVHGRNYFMDFIYIKCQTKNLSEGPCQDVQNSIMLPRMVKLTPEWNTQVGESLSINPNDSGSSGGNQIDSGGLSSCLWAPATI